MKENQHIGAIILAVLAAVFFSLNTPLSKLLLTDVPVTYMASFLYIGAGIGVGLMYLLCHNREERMEPLSRSDLPYAVGMIVLDIAAPIFLMWGISIGSASNASLLTNFEIVTTTIIALLLFKERVSLILWLAIALITISSGLLSFDTTSSFQFSYGSIFVILATVCWGLENNCTRQLSSKSTYEIVVLKGLFSGGGSFVIASLIGESLPHPMYILFAMVLGFIAYGVSIFLYIRAQRELGAAKTSAYYAIAPFVGAFLSFLVNGEALTEIYFVAFLIMVVGTVLIVYDTIRVNHVHYHMHTIYHTHGGSYHSHAIRHEHAHHHVLQTTTHTHKHTDFMNSKAHRKDHEAQR